MQLAEGLMGKGILRQLLGGSIASLALCGTGLAAAADYEQTSIDPSQIRVLASDVQGPEGPSVLPDGSIAMVEFMSGNILQVDADGGRDSLAKPGPGVAGTALGLDQALYVAKLNPGSFGPAPTATPTVKPPSGADAAPPALPSSPAALIRIDLKTHETKSLYSEYKGEKLMAPNDLAIDKWGDIWFTDATSNTVYWGRSDGSELRLAIDKAKGVNGITLSPDAKTIYIAANNKLLAYSITGRGQLKQKDGAAEARTVADMTIVPGADGMKTEANGDILLACWADGIVRYSPEGKLLSQTKVPGYRVINMVFGGKDNKTLYLAANPAKGMVGYLLAIPWPRAGLKLP